MTKNSQVADLGEKTNFDFTYEWMDFELGITSQDYHLWILKYSFDERKRYKSSEAVGPSPHQLTSGSTRKDEESPAHARYCL